MNNHSEIVRSLRIARIAVGILTLVGVTVAICLHRADAGSKDRLAVAYAFGQLQGFLLSTNYPAAYELMSSDFRRTHPFQVFNTMGEREVFTRMFPQFDWKHGAQVNVNGNHAELRLKYNPRFGTAFQFVKEAGMWRFTNRTIGFE